MYNRVNDLGSQNGIQTNDGASGKLYGNLVYDVGGHGIIVSGPVDDWEVHHNTVINAGKDGLQLYTEGAKGGNVAIRNNILEGKDNDLRCMIRNGGKKAVGERNILLSKSASGHYEGRNDMRANKDDLFVSTAKDDYRLKDKATAIDAGVTIGSYTKSHRGFAINNKHDIGAFEFGGSLSAPAPGPAPAPAPTPEPPAPAPSPELLASVNVENPTLGLQYSYYEGSYSKLPNFSQLKATKSGKTNTFDLSKRTRDNDIGFVFAGYFKAPQDGVYTFYTTSDDGSQLFIGDRRVVDNDGIHPAQERSGSIGLKKGFHPIQVTFFERSGGETLSVQVKSSGSSKRNISAQELFVAGKKIETPAPEPSPAPAPTPTPTGDNGLNYRYYEGDWSQLPNFSTLKVHKEGKVSGFDLSVRQRNEKFGIVYYGDLQIDKSSEYTFYTKSDDGSTLFIDGKLVVDNDGLHGPRERSGKITLSTGRHTIEVRFFERSVGQILEVRYAASGITEAAYSAE